MPQENFNSQRIVIIADPSREAPLLETMITQHGHDAVLCSGICEAREEVERGAGVLVVAYSVVDESGVEEIHRVLAAQPAWSKLPIIVVLPKGLKAFAEVNVFGILEKITSVDVVESPVHAPRLIRSIRVALAGRNHQYQNRDLMLELEHSKHDVIEANQAKSDFLANISHEIRTPLGAILGFAELLMDSGCSRIEKQNYMVAAKRNGQMLSALIDDILDLSRVEAGRIEIAKINFSLRELIADVVTTLEPLASKKGLSFVVERDRKLDHIIADPIRLKQILINIAGNAIKFTGHGSVFVKMKLDDSGEKPILTIEVEDTGIGISSPQAAHLFRPFTQVDTSTTRAFGGTGLGLVLSQKLSRAMGGDLELKWSIPGGGSNFTVTLPIQVSEVARPARAECPARAEAKLTLHGTTILLVDDSLDNQMLISRLLMLLGAKVELASDGIEGMEKAQAHDFDVVLMDLQMPRLGGVEATRKLRANGYQRPIVALTAHSLQEDRQRCINVGCSDYLTKPIQRSHLVQVIERLSHRTPVRPTASAGLFESKHL